jgi:hypothetical protein
MYSSKLQRHNSRRIHDSDSCNHDNAISATYPNGTDCSGWLSAISVNGLQERARCKGLVDLASFHHVIARWGAKDCPESWFKFDGPST